LNKSEARLLSDYFNHTHIRHKHTDRKKNYQKKTVQCIDSKVHQVTIHSLSSTLCWHGLNPIKLASDPHWPDAAQLTASTYDQLGSMPALLVTGSTTVKQNVPLLP